MLEDTDEVGLTAAVEARYPHGRLGRAIPVSGVGVEDALESVLVLALTYEALQLVLQDIPLVGVLGPVDVGDTIVRNLKAQRRPDEQVVVGRHAMSFCGSMTRAR